MILTSDERPTWRSSRRWPLNSISNRRIINSAITLNNRDINYWSSGDMTFELFHKTFKWFKFNFLIWFFSTLICIRQCHYSNRLAIVPVVTSQTCQKRKKKSLGQARKHHLTPDPWPHHHRSMGEPNLCQCPMQSIRILSKMASSKAI